jgi:hypothetical protein
MAYHREAAEVLMPWVIDWDGDCIWASQLIQTMDNALIYRNHQMMFSSLVVSNKQHRKYARNCLGKKKAFDFAIQGFFKSIPDELKHCSIQNEKQLALFKQGSQGGKPRPKLVNYHLMDYLDYNYSRLGKELDLCKNKKKWSQADVNCCSVDVFSLKLDSSVAPYSHLQGKRVMVTLPNNSKEESGGYYILGNKRLLLTGEVGIYLVNEFPTPININIEVLKLFVIV